MMRSSIILWFAVIIFVVFVFWLPSIVTFEGNLPTVFVNHSWIVRLCLNLSGYATIIIPGYVILRYVKRNEQMNPSNFISPLIKHCFVGHEPEKPKLQEKPDRTTLQDFRTLSTCAVGLATSYLIWGYLQEKIMTTDYTTPTNTSRFTDSQFLVFVNRISAFALSGCTILLTPQPQHPMPLYRYSYCSFSNIMSSWCQYEALKFVSFPVQVLTKASKVIPVMIMGKIVSKKSYEYFEYATAICISAGMTMFLFGSAEQHKNSGETTLAGLIILFGYMIFDSFTSNWQHKLFIQYDMTWLQMMCGVNVFSCLFTGVSLLQQSGFASSFQFMFTYPRFVFDVVILSFCSAVGQMFVFYTISQFGAVVFAYIMTFRQCLAVLLSCVVYKHVVDGVGVMGITLVFIAIFVRIYCNQARKRTVKRTGGDDVSRV